MSGPLGLAWRYVRHHKVKSLILIASVVLTVLLPVTIRILLWQFNQKVASRADATQAVVGATGSDLDLALNATYFRICLLYTSPSPRDRTRSRMPSSA